MTKRRRYRAATLVALVVVLVVSGCGGNGDHEAPVDAVRTLPACANAGSSVSRPAQLPADFPLPPGTLLTSSEQPFPQQLIVRGFVPADVQAAARFFARALPEGGYQLGRGDSEAGEAESLFTGNGFRGGWRVNAIPNCPAAVTLTLVLVRSG